VVNWVSAPETHYLNLKDGFAFERLLPPCRVEADIFQTWSLKKSFTVWEIKSIILLL
jgi:hypothetical protein